MGPATTSPPLRFASLLSPFLVAVAYGAQMRSHASCGVTERVQHWQTGPASQQQPPRLLRHRALSSLLLLP
jgi:hypothetical protein